MRRTLFASLLTALALPLLVTACGSTSATSADKSAEKQSNSSSAETTVPKVDPAAFRAGMAWFFTDSSATTPVSLPADLSTCTATKLDEADASTIAGLKSASASDSLPDPVGIRVFRATLACDRGTVEALFVKQIDLAKLGADATQQTCVTTGLMDSIATLDDTKATGKGGEAMSVPFGAALDKCIPLAQGLAAILADPSNGIPASSVDCIAGAAAKALTWAQVVDNTNQAAVKAAMQAAAAGCTSGN